MTLVYIKVGGDVKNIQLALVARVDVELLGIECVELLDSEFRGQVNKTVVVQIHVLLVPVCLLYIGIERGLGFKLGLRLDLRFRLALGLRVRCKRL